MGTLQGKSSALSLQVRKGSNPPQMVVLAVALLRVLTRLVKTLITGPAPSAEEAQQGAPPSARPARPVSHLRLPPHGQEESLLLP